MDLFCVNSGKPGLMESAFPRSRKFLMLQHRWEAKLKIKVQHKWWKHKPLQLKVNLYRRRNATGSNHLRQQTPHRLQFPIKTKNRLSLMKTNRRLCFFLLALLNRIPNMQRYAVDGFQTCCRPQCFLQLRWVPTNKRCLRPWFTD